MSNRIPEVLSLCKPVDTDRGRMWGIEGLTTADGMGGSRPSRLVEVFSVEEIAQRIVLTWAAHNDLLALAKDLRGTLLYCLNADGSWEDMPASHKRQLLIKAEAAIAKAE